MLLDFFSLFHRADAGIIGLRAEIEDWHDITCVRMDFELSVTMCRDIPSDFKKGS